MTIPHNIRSIARGCYRSWLYTGKKGQRVGGYLATVKNDGTEVCVTDGDEIWFVPVAKSWL